MNGGRYLTDKSRPPGEMQLGLCQLNSTNIGPLESAHDSREAMLESTSQSI
jgi:hypothetical protein